MAGRAGADPPRRRGEGSGAEESRSLRRVIRKGEVAAPGGEVGVGPRDVSRPSPVDGGVGVAAPADVMRRVPVPDYSPTGPAFLFGYP